MARVRKERVRKPRKQRVKKVDEEKAYAPDHQKEAGYWDWLNTRKHAADVLNAARERPYWASISDRGGNPPQAGYFPCTMFRKGGRVLYGFLIRQHREHFVRKHRDLNARRELTGDDNGPLLH